MFVDDAIRGLLPGVCAKEGVPTGSQLTIDQEVGATGRIGVLWLLLLVGPVGWLALLFLAGRDSGEHLIIQVPFGDHAYERLREGRRTRGVGIAIAVGGALVGFLLAATVDVGAFAPFLIAAAVLIGVLLGVAGALQVGRASIGVTLDASRRWVTLDGVHKEFVAACVAHESADHRR